MLRASSIWPTVTLQRPIASISAVALQRRERADAGRERRARIGRVQLVEVDALDAERAPAGLARGEQMARAAVGDPAPVRPRQPALGGDADARSIAAPRRERAGDQPLVVPALGLVQQ